MLEYPCVIFFIAFRLFKVNGEPIFIRGGNWILSDGLLRLSKKRYRTDIKFHADMNFNMMRCWGGGIAERPEFYHYCDIYGLLVSLTVPISSLSIICSHSCTSMCVLYDRVGTEVGRYDNGDFIAGLARILDNWGR